MLKVSAEAISFFPLRAKPCRNRSATIERDIERRRAWLYHPHIQAVRAARPATRPLILQYTTVRKCGYVRHKKWLKICSFEESGLLTNTAAMAGGAVPASMRECVCAFFFHLICTEINDLDE